MSGLGRYYEIDVTCRGHPDPATGYLVDIRQIDRVVRTQAVPIIAQACEQTPTTEPATILPLVLDAVLGGEIAGVDSVRWRLNPWYCVEMKPMQRAEPSTVDVRVRFDFAAAHRLHVPALSEDDNRRIFGHCNNPNSHGHNYQIEPCVRVPVGAGRSPLAVRTIEAAVKDTILDRFDHKNLNCDTLEFSAESGVNPSVENMARVFFGLLEPAVAVAHPGAALVSMTVWETDRTSATFPG